MIDFEKKARENLNTFNRYISEDSRFKELQVMYEVFGNELIFAPASANTQYHNAFPGGYLDHVINVTGAAVRLAELYQQMGGTVNFTRQELIFSALHHDLGKLGTEDGPYYVDQDSDWHRKRGEVYKHNSTIQYFKVPERGLMMLQKHGIVITENEWLSIKLSDGLYYDGNKSYLMNSTPGAMKTSLPYIIHWADHLASRVEKDFYNF
jgi:hypothetical protein